MKYFEREMKILGGIIFFLAKALRGKSVRKRRNKEKKQLAKPSQTVTL